MHLIPGQLIVGLHYVHCKGQSEMASLSTAIRAGIGGLLPPQGGCTAKVWLQGTLLSHICIV